MWWTRKRRERELADAREEALHWYERLGGQVMNLPPGEEAATRQALVDAGERYNAAGSQLDRATSVAQFQLARESALEGLAYVRAARLAMKLDPGPELPPLASQRGVGAIGQDREVQVEGRPYRASAHPADATPYYYPGGRVSGRPVPAGWYSEPWWKTALVAGAWGIGSVMVFDALLAPSWGDYGYGGGFNQGYDAGFAAGDNQGYDAGYAAGDNQGYDVGAGQGGYDSGYGTGGNDPGGYGPGGYDPGSSDPGGYGTGGSDLGGSGPGGYDPGGYDPGSYDAGSYDGGGGFDSGGGFDGGGFDF